MSGGFFAELSHLSCHCPSPSSQEMGPRQNKLPSPPTREILLCSGLGCKLFEHVLPVPWLELLRKTSATSKVISECRHPRLTVGTTGCCQREQPPWEARTAKLNNRRLVPHPPPPPQEQQPSHCSPRGWDQGALLVGPASQRDEGPLPHPALTVPRLWALTCPNNV